MPRTDDSHDHERESLVSPEANGPSGDNSEQPVSPDANVAGGDNSEQPVSSDSSVTTETGDAFAVCRTEVRETH
jgi:hypothetical protein